MIDSEEMKKRILGKLEEAGNEMVISLLADVNEVPGDPQDIKTLETSLRELLGEQLIVIRMFSMPYGVQTLSDADGLAEIGKLSSHYVFDVEQNSWKDSRDTGPPYLQTPQPEVSLTKAGRERSIALVEELGHEWWW